MPDNHAVPVRIAPWLALFVGGAAAAATGGAVAQTTLAQAPIRVVADLAGLSRRAGIDYLKASNAGAYEHFGETVALSADGRTLAVGAIYEGSASSGIGGDQDDDSAPNAGAVYVFVRDGEGWSQQAYIKASNAEAGDRFGASLALSADGDTLAVGATGEDSAAAGTGGDQADNSMDNAGAAYVFAREGTAWSQQAYIKASNTGGTEEGDQFGYDVALNAGGTTLAVSAIAEDSAATGIGGAQDDDSAPDSGAVYVFVRDGGGWSQQAYVKPRPIPGDTFVESVLFGFAIGLDARGDTLAASAYNEDTNRGRIYVFTRDATQWSEQARFRGANAEQGDALASAIAVSADGDTIVGGAFDEDSVLLGVAPADAGADDYLTNLAVGAAYVFVRDGTEWSQQAFIKPTNTQLNQHFGWAVALSRDGTTVAVGAHFEDGASSGINGDQRDASAPDAGAVYVYRRSGSVWTPIAYVKASNSSARAEFGTAVALNADGTVLAVGAPREAGGGAGIAPEPTGAAAPESGAVYVY